MFVRRNVSVILLSDRNFCLPSAVRLNGLLVSYHAFLFAIDITDLKNGHVIPKFWVLENFILYTISIVRIESSEFFDVETTSNNIHKI